MIPSNPPARPLKGRGALSNPAGRFESRETEAADDGWWQEAPAERVETVVLPERARSIITENRSPDVPFDCSINPYRGCEHGCIYCYARPSHGYVGLSAGIDFETRLFYKADAARILTGELAAPGYRCRPVTIGANTDPYQPIERDYRITREILAVLSAARHPVSIITKSALILRDIDLLTPLASLGIVRVYVSITTLDDDTKRVLEPRTASGAARLRTVRALAAAGIPVGVLVAPVIPGITDHELEDIVAASAAAGAASAGYIVLRLPHETAPLFDEWLVAHFPDRAAGVWSLIRSMREGRANDARFGTRMRGTGPLAELTRRRFALACARVGLASDRHSPPLPTGFFRPPLACGAQQALDF